MIIECPSAMYFDSQEKIGYDQPDFPLYLRLGHLADLFEHRAKPHYHEDFEYILIFSGQLNYDVNGQKIQLGTGEGIFVNSKALHFGYGQSNDDCDYLCLLFSPMLLAGNKSIEETCLTPYLEGGPSYLVLRKGSEPLAVLEKLWQEKANGANRLSYLSLLFSLWKETLPLFPALTPEKPSSSLEKMKTMIAYLDENYGEDISLAALSRISNVSPSEVNKLFRLYTHQSPMAYLIDYRLGKAAACLKETNQSVEEIAFGCGYSSPSFFIRSFKRKYQETPIAYRHRKQE